MGEARFEKALSEIPTAYAVALRMRSEDGSDGAIAKALGIPEQSVDRFVEIGKAKLKAIME